MQFIDKISSDGVSYSIPTSIELDFEEYNITDIFLLLYPNVLSEVSTDILNKHLQNIYKLPLQHSRCLSIIKNNSYNNLVKTGFIDMKIINSTDKHKIIINKLGKSFKVFNSAYDCTMSASQIWLLSHPYQINDMTILDILNFLEELTLPESDNEKFHRILVNKLSKLDGEKSDIIMHEQMVKIWPQLLREDFALKNKFPQMHNLANKILRDKFTKLSIQEYSDLCIENIKSKNLYNFVDVKFVGNDVSCENFRTIKNTYKTTMNNVRIDINDYNIFLFELIVVRNKEVLSYIIDKSIICMMKIIHILAHAINLDYELLELVMDKFTTSRGYKLGNILFLPTNDDIPLFRDFLNIKFPNLILYSTNIDTFCSCMNKYLLSTRSYELIQLTLKHCSKKILIRLKELLMLRINIDVYFGHQLVRQIDRLL